MRDPEGASRELVDHLRALIRLKTVNPPGDEIAAAHYLAKVLAGAGLEARVMEPEPGRGSVVARLRGDGSGGGPLLLLGHLDVVPAEAERWTRDPFEAEIVDGYVYGRGAVDMKAMVAMELQVVLGLAADVRAAGGQPDRDAVPGLRRDVIFAATADEETGGHLGAGWIVDHEPELLQADACLTEAGGVSVELAGRRCYAIGAAEKGYLRLEIGVEGGGGHAAMPRDDNAAVLAGRIVTRLGQPTPQRVTPLMAAAVRTAAAQLPGDPGTTAERLLTGDAAAVCDAPTRRALHALLRDTISPTIVRAGVKENVIPGRATIVVDCRTLPGTTAETMEARLREQVGPELWAHCRTTRLSYGEPLEQPLPNPLYDLCAATLERHDPGAFTVPVMVPFATDAKHTVRLGIPTYGFSPLRLAPDEPFLERFHGDDERVGLDALRFGLPVLDEVVRTYCG
ncbi:MAG: M20/M25/M40 family metallo-hydrolase [Candidatus Limnocylindrales bacterium]